MARNLGPVEYSEEDTYSAYEATDTPSPGGSTSLEGLTDVDISNPSDGQTLVYNATTEKWENGESAGGGFTLLHGIYSIMEDETEIVTLPITASALYALSQTTTVAFDYVVPTEVGDRSHVDTIYACEKQQEEGYADLYTFMCSTYATDRITATDAVVFVIAGK